MIAVTDHVESERYPAMLCYFWKANFNILDIGLSCISKTAKIYYEFIKGSFPKLSLACMIDKEKYHDFHKSVRRQQHFAFEKNFKRNES